MRLKTENTFVLDNHTEILGALVGLKDVVVLAFQRRGPAVTLVIEQTPGEVRCPSCHRRAHVKERPVVTYVDLPVYGTAMSLSWKKHRMCCVNPECATGSWVLSRPHRREVLPADHAGGHVGDAPGGRRAHGVGRGPRAGL